MTNVVIRGGYLDRALANLRAFDASRDGALLFYASLEFRFAIERFLFAYLTRVRADISKTQEKLYEAGKLRAAILDAEPDFFAKLRFTNLCVAAMQLPLEIPLPDLDHLGSLYGKIGRYLHAIKRPGDTLQNPEWWSDFLSVLHETETTLAPLASQPIAGFKLNENGLALFEEFKSGKKTPEEVKSAFIEALLEAAEKESNKVSDAIGEPVPDADSSAHQG